MKEKGIWISGYPNPASPGLSPSIYPLWFYLQKLIMEHSRTLHKKWTWGAFQVLESCNQSINQRGEAGKNQGIWILAAGTKLKLPKNCGKAYNPARGYHLAFWVRYPQSSAWVSMAALSLNNRRSLPTYSLFLTMSTWQGFADKRAGVTISTLSSCGNSGIERFDGSG